MFEIYVPDKNDSLSKVVLSGTTYYLRFTLNGRYGYWSIGLYDASKNPMLPMTKISPCIDLFQFYPYIGFPEGHLVCVSQEDDVDTDAFTEARARMFYFTDEDMETMAGLLGLEWTEDE